MAPLALLMAVLISSFALVSSLPMPSLVGRAAFTIQNGQDAINQNNQFASLTPDSTCQDGQQACVKGAFAQCTGGKFALSQCSAGTSCFALPLVNKAGTSLACTSQADKDQRIATTGATSGGGGSSSASSNSATGNASAQPPSTNTNANANADNASPSDGGNGSSSESSSTSAAGGQTGGQAGFVRQNALDAQKLNTQFQTLKADSSCTDGQSACIQGKFAQCSGSKFQATACSAGTTCMALPLVNKAGTSVTCDVQADGIARMTAAGASGSLTG